MSENKKTNQIQPPEELVLCGASAYNQKFYINENFSSNITLKTLSDRFAVSSSHISNEFTRIYGVSPIHYLIDIRLSVARGFLINTNYSVQEIALRVGYENCNHFTNLFQKRIGTSPNEYRKHHASRR